jgi:hypothetical protein
MDNTTPGLMTQIMGWVKQPFSEKMDLVHWLLFTGLLITMAIFWTRVLRNITE